MHKGWWLLLCLMPLLVQAQTYPEPKGFVNDFAGVLTPQQATQLDAYLTQFAQQTSNEIAVAVLELPEGSDVETYTGELARAWKIGGDADNGVLLAVYPTARKVRIEVGYGLEGAIPDILASRIIQERVTPSFREGDYYTGILLGVEGLTQAARGEYDTTTGREYYERQQPKNKRGSPIIILVIIIVLFVILSRGGGGKGGGYNRSGRYDRGGGFWIFPFPTGGWGSGGGSSWGGSSGGGWGGGDFGGFGGGDFGGGGASGDW
ncbi:MAG: hypothetical protein OHK0039_21840 [Bacteroidia bacterium]